MTASNEFLTSTNYSISIDGMPELSVAVQGFNHPSITNRPAKQSTRRLDLPVAGTKVDYGELSISLNLDDNLNSYDDLFDWFLNCTSVPATKTITLTVYSVSGKPKKKFIYHDAFPVSLGGLRFNSKDADDPLISMDAGFAYSAFELRNA